MRAGARWTVTAAVLVAQSWALAACGATTSTTVSESFVPATATSSAQLRADATVLAARLRAYGVRHATAFSTPGHVVVQVSGSSFPTLPRGLLATGRLRFRPVLCGAPAYAGPPSAAGSVSAVPPCTGASRMSAQAFAVDQTTGQPRHTPPPDAALAAVPSTPASEDRADATVLLPEAQGSGNWAPRLVLGPAALTVGPTDASVTPASAGPGPADLVFMTLDPSRATAWDRLAKEQFHALVGLDLDGVVISATLTSPTQQVFTSFGGKVAFSAPGTRTDARVLAAQLASGPLAVPLHR